MYLENTNTQLPRDQNEQILTLFDEERTLIGCINLRSVFFDSIRVTIELHAMKYGSVNPSVVFCFKCLAQLKRFL